MAGSTTICIDANEFPVSSVVVFRTQAEVTRSFPIELQAGNNDLEIKGLPNAIQHDSLRIQGVGKGVTLLDHAISSAPTRSLFSFNEPAKVKELRASKKAAEAELKVLAAQAEVLLSYSKSMTAEHVKPEAFMEYMAVFGQAGVQNVDAVKQKEKEIEEINAQIKKELEASRTSSERNEDLRLTIISVVLNSETELKVAELKITDVANGASWTPAYEIRATTDANGQLNKTVSLHYKAAITQSTGEDWKNTKLTLNTTSPTLARAILPHSGLKIQPGAAPNGQNGGFPDRFNKPAHPGMMAQQRAAAPFVNRPAGFGLFGSSNVSSGGLFGNTATVSTPAFGASRPQQQQAPQAGGLFGQPASVQQPTTGFGGFGQTAPSLFGQPASVQQPTTGFGGFGQTAPSVGASAFGAAPAGSSAFGAAVAASDEPQGFAAESTDTVTVDPAAMGDAAFNYADAVAESTAVSATYKIEGKTTILSGIATHKVVISTSTVLPIEVYVVTMPRVQPWACLQAKIKNTSTEPLLAGLASIFNDDSYVSSTQMSLVSPGDSFICSLGMDNKIKVSFAHKDGNVVINNIPFTGNTENVLSTNTIKVKNNRNVSISRLIIRDAVPVGQDPVKVLLKTPAELATVASADATVKVAEGAVARWSKEKANSREEGLVEWVLDDTQSGEEKKVELAWSVDVPQGFKWSYSF